MRVRPSYPRNDCLLRSWPDQQRQGKTVTSFVSRSYAPYDVAKSRVCKLSCEESDSNYIPLCGPRSLCHSFFCSLFIYLAVPGLSCSPGGFGLRSGRQDLQDLSLRPVGASFPIRDRTRTSCIGSVES